LGSGRKSFPSTPVRFLEGGCDKRQVNKRKSWKVFRASFRTLSLHEEIARKQRLDLRAPGWVDGEGESRER
jgi:hypothetical protein